MKTILFIFILTLVTSCWESNEQEPVEETSSANEVTMEATPMDQEVDSDETTEVDSDGDTTETDPEVDTE